MRHEDERQRTVYIVPHTHWDREWYAPFQTFRAQLVDLWDELLTLTEADPEFRFLMDGQTVVIDDYLAVRPEAEPRLDRAIREGRIEVGPWYTLPDEFLVSGETLVRNLQRGLASAERHGGSLHAGYLPDSFGHPTQMPQIYRQFGFDHALVWRGVPLAIDRLAFAWQGPDGSEILTAYMGNSYSHGVDLPTEPAALAARIDAAIRAMAPFKPTGDVLLMNGNDHVLPQRALTAAIRAANDQRGRTRLRMTGLGEYLHTLTGGDWPRWCGELRSSARANVLMGTLSVRIPDKQRYFHASLRLERVAEPLAALSALDSTGLLDQAWTLVLQNAAHDTACGSGIDLVAEEARLRSAAAVQITDAVTARCLPRLAGGGQVWNPSAFPRRGLVELDVDAVPPAAQPLPQSPEMEPVHLRVPAEEVGRAHAVLDERQLAGDAIQAVVVTRDGDTVRVAVDTRRGGTSIDLAASRLEIERLANQPGMEAIALAFHRHPSHRVLIETPLIDGLSVAALAPAPGRADVEPARGAGHQIENGLLRCQLGPDGTLTIEHKATGLTYAGLNRLVDEGDAGDEYNFSPPVADRRRGPAALVAVPRLREDGPLRASVETTVRYLVPTGLQPDRRQPEGRDVSLTMSLTVSLERDCPRVDIAMTVENPARDHRLRAHFPVPFAVTESCADTPYHVTRRPAILPRRDPGAPEVELPTYPMRSFVDVSGDRGGVALITHGLHEYEVIPGPTTELALTLLRAVGWLSRDDLRTRTGHAGPPMETPGAQLLGAHHYRYSLLFHRGNWEEAAVWRAADVALLPLMLGAGDPISGSAPSIQLEPASIQMIACIPHADGYDLRLLNASDRQQDAIVRIRRSPLEVHRLDLGGAVQASLRSEDGILRLPFRQWEIATLRIRHGGRLD